MAATPTPMTSEVLSDSGLTPARTLPWYAWLLLLPVFLLYSNTFVDYAVLEQRHSVLADGDVAQFSLLISQFDVTRKYGDEYNTVNRGRGDIAQKHKIHHITYVFVGSVLFTLLAPLYGLFGAGPQRAIYAVNAIIACVNIFLLYRLLLRHNVNGNSPLPFLLFFAFALNTWIFAAVPESWPFSATLVLLFFLWASRGSYLQQGVWIGVIMLNNIFLAALWLIHVAELYRKGWRKGALVFRAFAAGLCAIATWAVILTALSVFDESFRPDHFIQYTLWFRKFAGGGGLPLWDPYVWQSAISNLFITSITAHQPDPAVPQESLLLTLQSSNLGRLSVGAYAILAGTAAWAFVLRVARQVKAEGLRILLLDRTNDVVIYCGIMLAATIVLFYSAGFLYATVLVPMITLFLCRNLDLARRPHALVFYAAILLIMITNTSQIIRFREALAAM